MSWKADGRRICGCSKGVALYRLLNETDQIMAAPDVFKTKAQAEAHADKLRLRFVAQGYYLTADGRRVAPADVKLVVVHSSK